MAQNGGDIVSVDWTVHLAAARERMGDVGVQVLLRSPLETTALRLLSCAAPPVRVAGQSGPCCAPRNPGGHCGAYPRRYPPGWGKTACCQPWSWHRAVDPRGERKALCGHGEGLQVLGEWTSWRGHMTWHAIHAHSMRERHLHDTKRTAPPPWDCHAATRRRDLRRRPGTPARRRAPAGGASRHVHVDWAHTPPPSPGPRAVEWIRLLASAHLAPRGSSTTRHGPGPWPAAFTSRANSVLQEDRSTGRGIGRRACACCCCIRGTCRHSGCG